MYYYLKKLFTVFLNLLFPIQCLNCNQEDVWLCSACINDIITKPHHQTTCPICNIQGYKNGDVCPTCQKEYSLNKIFIAADYENELIQKLIKTFKYNFVKNLNSPIAEIMINYFKQINSINQSTSINFVISSPLSKKRLRWRGFNQSELLAQIIAEKLNYNYLPDLIVKTKHTEEQAELNREQRLKNVKNVFQVNRKYLAQRPAAGGALSGYFLIIDDVITTGATLGEMAKVLKSNGVKEIWALVLAKN